jgi:16S rRNA (guanine527-N7)-methyltransferase
MLNLLREGAQDYGVHLSDQQHAQFERYLALLGEWSQRANLVGNLDPDVVQRRHFLESVAFGVALRERELLRPGADVLDIGAGAGFPGMVLKIVWPTISLTLIEATAKKTAFLSALVEALGLERTEVITGRAEVLAHAPRLRERFDLVVARAVAPLAVLVELALPFARVGGRLVTPKGSRASEEVRAASHALQVLGGEVFTAPLKLPGPPQTLVAVVKRQSTPAALPRRPGVPARSPLSRKTARKRGEGY